MIEFAVPFALLVAAVIPKKKISDKKAIDLIFKRTGIGVKDEKGNPLYPKRGKTFPIIINGAVIGKTHTYRMPIGLPSTKIASMSKDSMVFEDALGKPVEVEYKDQYLKIHVYNDKMPTDVKYSDIMGEFEDEEMEDPDGENAQSRDYARL